MTENNNYVDANVITWTWQYSLHSNSHYPGEPGLDSFIGAKNDGSGGDNSSHHQRTSTQLLHGSINVHDDCTHSPFYRFSYLQCGTELLIDYSISVFQ